MTSTSHCFDKHDLNEENCKFYPKCPEGKERNKKNFRCVTKKEIVVKKRVEKRKNDEKKRLTLRADNLTTMAHDFFRNGNGNGNATEKSKVIRTKLINLRRLTTNKDMPELTENLTSVIDRMNEFRKSKKQTKSITPRKKRVVINTTLKQFNNFEEDLRNISRNSSSNSPSKSPDKSPDKSPSPLSEVEEVNLNAVNLKSPDSPKEMTEEQKQKIVNAYAKKTVQMMSMLNFGKLEKMTRKPKETLRSRKTSSNKPSRRRKVGSSLNGPSTKPRASRRKKASQNDISL